MLTSTLRDLGHVVPLYVVSRSMRPASPPEAELVTVLSTTIGDLPSDVDLVLPADAARLELTLAAWDLDLLVVYGFNWRIPGPVLRIPRLGVLNLHPSPLPRFRGPSALPWVVRSGDRDLVMTCHVMTEEIDAGPILVQRTVGEVPDEATRDGLAGMLEQSLPRVLAEALVALRAGRLVEQDHTAATRAPFPDASWHELRFDQPRAAVHNQVRASRFLNSEGPRAWLDGRRILVPSTSLDPGVGERVPCADGPIWITDSVEISDDR